MFKSITIKNFRCFDFITLDRLERINLIGGSNNVGKTALLEALFLRLMGEGMARLLSIVLSIMNAKDGTILIDEVENGLHHSILEKIWEAIALAARKSNAQIFATTHSWECIEAAHQAFSKSEIYDFRYYRLEADKQENKVKVLTYNRDTINTSVKMQLEMR